MVERVHSMIGVGTVIQQPVLMIWWARTESVLQKNLRSHACLMFSRPVANLPQLKNLPLLQRSRWVREICSIFVYLCD